MLKSGGYGGPGDLPSRVNADSKPRCLKTYKFRR